MNACARNAYAAYQKNELESLSTAEIVVKLYEKLRVKLCSACEDIEAGRLASKAEAMSLAVAILTELQASLDLEQGGEIAANLNDLYGYLISELVVANMKNDTQKIRSSLKVVEPLLEAWIEIAKGQKSEGRPARSAAEYRGAVEAAVGSVINY